MTCAKSIAAGETTMPVSSRVSRTIASMTDSPASRWPAGEARGFRGSRSPEGGNPHHDEHAELGVARLRLPGYPLRSSCPGVRRRTAARNLTMRGAFAAVRSELAEEGERVWKQPVPLGSRSGKGSTPSSPLLTYSSPRGLRQAPGRGVKSPAVTRTCGMRVAKCVCCCRRTGHDAGPLPGRRFSPGKSFVTRNRAGNGE